MMEGQQRHTKLVMEEVFASGEARVILAQEVSCYLLNRPSPSPCAPSGADSFTVYRLSSAFRAWAHQPLLRRNLQGFGHLPITPSPPPPPTRRLTHSPPVGTVSSDWCAHRSHKARSVCYVSRRHDGRRTAALKGCSTRARLLVANTKCAMASRTRLSASVSLLFDHWYFPKI